MIKRYNHKSTEIIDKYNYICAAGNKHIPGRYSHT